MMISVYVLFLFNIGSSVYLMKLERTNIEEQASKYNKQAQKLLPLVVIILAITTIPI